MCGQKVKKIRVPAHFVQNLQPLEVTDPAIQFYFIAAHCRLGRLGRLGSTVEETLLYKREQLYGEICICKIAMHGRSSSDYKLIHPTCLPCCI